MSMGNCKPPLPGIRTERQTAGMISTSARAVALLTSYQHFGVCALDIRSRHHLHTSRGRLADLKAKHARSSREGPVLIKALLKILGKHEARYLFQCVTATKRLRLIHSLGVPLGKVAANQFPGILSQETSQRAFLENIEQRKSSPEPSDIVHLYDSKELQVLLAIVASDNAVKVERRYRMTWIKILTQAGSCSRDGHFRSRKSSVLLQRDQGTQAGPCSRDSLEVVRPFPHQATSATSSYADGCRLSFFCSADRLQHNYDHDLPTMKPDISSLSCGDVACAGGSNCRCDSVLGGGLVAHPQVRTGRSFRLSSACQPLGRSIGVVRRLALALACLQVDVGLDADGTDLYLSRLKNHEWLYMDSCIVLDMHTLHHDRLPLQQRNVNIAVPFRSGLLWVTPANNASLL
ncbi:hypothetical protein C8F01DRAFT_1258196 [Mycena amicta]|nr:hypothetical protein C8F01DRAFT_1258196 [Mycena amicta]